jgi:mannose-6-phosphate isomerase
MKEFLTFETIYKEKIWGGTKIKTVLHKDIGNLPNCGETWELSGVNGNISRVAHGAYRNRDLKSLINEFQGILVGERIYKQYGDEFPLLVKFIDAAQDLSIQVHPNDELAKNRHNGFGKTEMWYVVQSDPGSTLISGFNQKVTPEAYQKHFESGKLMEILNREKVNAHDVFFLPAGRVHTIGKGLLIAEIQQTSDITYRIYDFDRVDAKGNKRELHVNEAMDAIDFNHYEEYKTKYHEKMNERNELVKCEYFTTNKLSLSETIEVALFGLDCFKIYTCVGGSGTIRCDNDNYSIGLGDVVLVPASIESYTIEPKNQLTLLESYID